jgi:hypothetical protein
MRGLLALGVALAACYDPNAATNVPCASNFMCPGTQQCDRGHNPPICVATLPADAAVTIDSPPADALPPDAPPGVTATLVQQTTKGDLSVSPLVAVLPSLPTKNNVLVMVGAATPGALASVSGGGVATWKNAAMSTANCNVEIWYGESDGSSASVAIAYPNNTGLIWMNVSEWSGLVAAGPLDMATASNGLTGDATAGTITTTHAHDLLLFAVTDHSPVTFGGPTPGSWSAMTTIDDNGCMQAPWYADVTTTGAYAPSTTQNNSGWEAAIAAFKIAP